MAFWYENNSTYEMITHNSISENDFIIYEFTTHYASNMGRNITPVGTCSEFN